MAGLRPRSPTMQFVHARVNACVVLPGRRHVAANDEFPAPSLFPGGGAPQIAVMQITPSDPRPFLRALFDAAVAAADPMLAVPPHLPDRPSDGRVLVLGAGKASARMAEAVEAAWGPCEGLILTRYGHGRPLRGIELVEAAHPVPDAAGLAGSARLLNLARGLGEEDLCLALISGGASSLLTVPRRPLTGADIAAVNAALLASGLPIGTMNQVRRQLDDAKGGRLAAAAWPARTLALAISDVPGDDPAVIGSGPTVGGADPAGLRAAAATLDVPGPVRPLLDERPYALPAHDPRLARCETRVIAAPSHSLSAARSLAAAAGVRVIDLGPEVEGEARHVAAHHAEVALEARGTGPVLILSGGELTVTRREGARGVGGPNAEYALAMAIALGGAADVHAIACDTDGVDGAAEVAGACIGPGTLARAREAGRDPARALEDHDAHGFFGATGDAVITGPTLTNVNDFRAILVR